MPINFTQPNGKPITEKQDGISFLMLTNRNTNRFLWNTIWRKEILEDNRPNAPRETVGQEDDGTTYFNPTDLKLDGPKSLNTTKFSQ